MSLTAYRIQRQISRGAFGTVYLADHLDSGRLYSIKVLCQSPEHEAQMMKTFDGTPGMVKFHEHFSDDRHRSFVVYEYVEGDNLYDCLKRLGFAEKLLILKQLVEIVIGIHDRGYVHGDLKPENILVDDKGHVCLIDYDSMGAIGSKPDMIKGTILYFSPELAQLELSDANEHMLTVDRDVWAVACMAYELINEEHPLMDEKLHLWRDKYEIRENDLRNIVALRYHRTEDSRFDWINQVLANQPDQRPTLRQIQQSLLALES